MPSVRTEKPDLPSTNSDSALQWRMKAALAESLDGSYQASTRFKPFNKQDAEFYRKKAKSEAFLTYKKEEPLFTGDIQHPVGQTMLRDADEFYEGIHGRTSSELTVLPHVPKRTLTDSRPFSMTVPEPNERVDDLVEKVRDRSEIMVHNVKETASDMVEGVKDKTCNVIESTKETAEGIIESVKDTTANIVDGVKVKTQNAVEVTKETAENIVECVKDTTANIVDGVKVKTQNAVEVTKETAENIIESVKDTTANIVDGVKEKTQNAVEVTKEKAGDLKVAIEERQAETKESIENSSFLNSIANSVIEGVSLVAGTASLALDKVKDTFSPPHQDAAESTKPRKD